MARPNRKHELYTAAAKVAHEQGLAELTLATVARAADMPIGGLYYYFKTREEVVTSVVDQLEQRMRACIKEYDVAGTPALSLKAFVALVLGNIESLAQHGCPIGTLTAQLRKEPGELGRRTGGILGVMAVWAEGKFRDLGLAPSKARQEGRMLLVQLEGAAMMAHATGERAFVTDIVAELNAHIDRLLATQSAQGETT